MVWRAEFFNAGWDLMHGLGLATTYYTLGLLDAQAGGGVAMAKAMGLTFALGRRQWGEGGGGILNILERWLFLLRFALRFLLRILLSMLSLLSR